MSKEAMKLALEALKYMDGYYISFPQQGMQAIKALEAALEAHKALAKQEQRNVTKNEHDVLMKALAKSGKVVDAGFLSKQEQGEPVGKIVDCDFVGNSIARFERHIPFGTLLYTTPQQRKPLTDEQIYDMYNEPRSDAEMLEFARAIEAAHGIKE
jgi:hypothetical protein